MGGRSSHTVSYVDNPHTLQQLQALTQQNSTLAAQISSLTTAVQQTKQSNEQTQAQYSSALNTIAQKDKTMQDLISSNQQQVSSLNQQITQSNIKTSQLQVQIQQSRTLLDNLTNQHNKKEQELRQLKDPKKIEQASKQLFKNFVGQLESFNVYNKIPKTGNLKYVAVIGENSAGKSSIYNWIFGLNLKVGVDDTTQNIQNVHIHQNILYWDSPGLNPYIDITNADTLKAFYQVDYVFIATAVTFKNSVKTIQVFDKINPPKLFLVRNQCDKFEKDEDFQAAVAKDRQVLTSIGVNRQILYISCKRGDDFKDNARFKKLMLGQN